MVRLLSQKLAAIPGITPLPIPDYLDVYSCWMVGLNIDADAFTCSPEEFADQLAQEGIAGAGQDIAGPLCHPADYCRRQVGFFGVAYQQRAQGATGRSVIKLTQRECGLENDLWRLLLCCQGNDGRRDFTAVRFTGKFLSNAGGMPADTGVDVLHASDHLVRSDGSEAIEHTECVQTL